MPILADAIAPDAGGDLGPDAPSAETDVTETVAASALLSFVDALQAGQTVTVGGIVYTAVASPEVAGDVPVSSLSGLVDGINGADGINDPNPLVRAAASGVANVAVTAIIPGASGNSIAWEMVKTGTTSGFLTGGVDGYPVSGTPGAVAAALTNGGNLSPSAPGAIA